MDTRVIRNGTAATAILGRLYDAKAKRRDELLSQSAAIEAELTELNPQIADLEAVFTPPAVAAPSVG